LRPANIAGPLIVAAIFTESGGRRGCGLMPG
jgi:hypothetical protein